MFGVFTQFHCLMVNNMAHFTRNWQALCMKNEKETFWGVFGGKKQRIGRTVAGCVQAPLPLVAE